MADALIGVAFENLISLLQNEFSTISRISSKAQKLSNNLDLIKAVLEDAEKKQLTDHSIKVWLQQLKDAVYVLDDVLDECSIQSNRLKGLSCFKPKNIIFRHNIGNRLKEITSRFDEIADRKNKFLLQQGVTAKEMTVEVAEWRQTSSIIAEPKVYGREDDKEKIVEFLLNQARRDSNSLSVYPIVGLGGVGKTTLAQLVYNDQRVSTTNFDTKIWVCVSESFSIKRILCSIIESIKCEKCDVLDLNVIQRKVQELLQGKRFLLVLDDVWNKNAELKFGLSQEKWNQLKSVLSSGSKGSSCLVSTRDEVVASITGTCQAHYLSGLSENECWLLFKQYAFGIDREELVELVEIGKEIAKKCRGLPLAAQALGGLMRSRYAEKEWLEIKESGLWDPPSDNYVLPALTLSYSYLTPTLKQCFAFCAIFPKDTIMLKEELIHLWMAHGFISSRKNLEVEDIGHMMWNELCQKSFFQDIMMDGYAGDMSFKMHDLVHDLAQSIMGQECLYLEDANMTSLSKSTHHISVHSDDLLSIDKGAFKKVESLRTFFQLNPYPKKNHHYFPTNCFLRVLRTSFIHAPSLGSLIHLRYLELRSLDIETLPDSIYNLQKIEILKIIGCHKLSCLPKRLVCLQNLRHLVVDFCDSLSSLFPNIGKISCLRTLSLYIVSLEKGNSLAELRDLNLGGELSIEGLNNVGSLAEAQEANLMCKKDLRVLQLSWKIRSDESTKTSAINAEQLLEVLQPHSNLKRLQIDYYEGLLLPSWISFLSNLVSLKLWDCMNCVRLPLIGNLQSLKKLELNNMVSLKYLDDESHDGIGFQSLQELYLSNLPNIEGLLKVERGEAFPCLSHMLINSCPKLGLPCLPSLKHLCADECNNEELLRSISTFCSLTTLSLLGGDEGITSFPEGMFTNLTFLQTLEIFGFSKLKELPNEPFNLALEHMSISCCHELESFPELIWESLQSLRSLQISYCKELRCLPEGIRNLTSLEVLDIIGCATLEERCKEGIGEDWYKIAHIPKVKIVRR
ncbi:putative disease resistance protein RGA4 [Trifolium pratense]|uniref:putative disease resistance protein RGA4 n=1 Tax=Trifolium pratense TaxID=57577 RepID=UPI001E690510|nr:putative disease resistance protein RGA4 [Trifolium pratense]XP_045786547.1 putative disease resistance protein RGA4 [Trifolium pratense]